MSLHLEILPSMSKVTKTVIACYNTMSEQEFMRAFSCSKARYYARVMKYRDPYMNAPLAKIGKWLLRLNKEGR